MKQKRLSEGARNKLIIAVAGVDDIMRDWTHTPLPYTNLEQLADIRNKLLAMLEGIEDCPRREAPGIWRNVVDTWPYENQLRQSIVEAELLYERLR